MNTAQLNDAMFAIVDAITDAVRGAGSAGTPGAILYLGLMQHGCTLAQFQSIIGAMVRAGRLTKRGDCYFIA